MPTPTLYELTKTTSSDRKPRPSVVGPKLGRHDWPGNVRELRNVVERAALMSVDSSVIHPNHLFLPDGSIDARRLSLNYDHEPTLDEIRHDYLSHLLDIYDGNRTKVAEVLGLGERSVYRLLERPDAAADQERG